MKRSALALFAVPAILALLPAELAAQTKDRWRLNWHGDRPKIHTHRDGLGRYENFWYVTYDITNNTDQVIPVLLDLQLYTESGKDLQHGTRKVERETIKDVTEHPAKAEELLYGRFHCDVTIPQHIEYRIIEMDAHLSNRSQGIIEESIEKFKAGDEQGNRWYLNCRDMRDARVILPGQRFHGIAIFRGVDPRSRVIQIHVSGLIDILRIEEVAEFETKLHYENHVRREFFAFTGDEFDREADHLIYEKSDWIIKRIGPASSKETLASLMNALLEVYRREKEWKDAGKTAEEIEALRQKHRLSRLDTNIMARVFRRATEMDFGYDEGKDVLDNEKPFWRMHEWWTTNQNKLVYNTVLNRFEVRDEPLPGTVAEDK